jgi:hypothetical protein
MYHFVKVVVFQQFIVFALLHCYFVSLFRFEKCVDLDVNIEKVSGWIGFGKLFRSKSLAAYCKEAILPWKHFSRRFSSPHCSKVDSMPQYLR